MDSRIKSVSGLNISHPPDSLDEKVDMQIQLSSNVILMQGRAEGRCERPWRPRGKGTRQGQKVTSIWAEFDF